MSTGHRLRAMAVAALVAGVLAGCDKGKPATTAPAEGDRIAPKVREILAGISRTIIEARSFQIDASTALYMRTQGIDNNMTAEVQMAVERPNRVAIIAKETAAGVTLVSDGTHLYTLIPSLRKYTVDDAPGTLEDIDAGSLAMGGGGMMFLQALLKNDPGAEMLEGVTEARYVGIEDVEGGKVHHLRFVQEQFDWDLWVDAGDKPLIRRILADMSKTMTAAAESASGMKDAKIQMEATFKNWRLNPDLPPDTFKFQPPKDAELAESLFGEPGDEEGPRPLLGETAPPLKLALLDGGRLDLAAHKGKDIVILDFWATRCAPCVQALPTLAALAAAYKDKHVVLYAVNVQEDRKTLERFLKQKNLSCAVALDPSGDAASAYGVDGIPHTVIIDKGGIVQVVHVGYGPGMKKMMAKQLDALVAGKNLAAEVLRKQAASKTVPASQAVAMESAWSFQGKWEAVAADPQSGEVYVVSGQGQVAQLDPAGKKLREFKLSDGGTELRLARLTGDAKPGLVTFRSWGPAVLASDAEGRQLWSHPGGQGVNDVCAADLDSDGLDEIIVGYNGATGLHALDKAGQPRWKYETIGNVWHVCAGDLTGAGKPEIVATSAVGKVRIFDATGTKLRDLDPGCYAFMVRLARLDPADRSRHIVVGGASGNQKPVLVLLTSDGKRVWSVPLEQAAGHIDSAAVATSRPWVAVGLRGGTVQVVELFKGEVLSEVKGQGVRPQVSWCTSKPSDVPTLLVATGRGLNAFRVPKR